MLLSGKKRKKKSQTWQISQLRWELRITAQCSPREQKGLLGPLFIGPQDNWLWSENSPFWLQFRWGNPGIFSQLYSSSNPSLYSSGTFWVRLWSKEQEFQVWSGSAWPSQLTALKQRWNHKSGFCWNCSVAQMACTHLGHAYWPRRNANPQKVPFVAIKLNWYFNAISIIKWFGLEYGV